MALNRRALQRELDLAADELDRVGYKDLADRVDRYSEMLMAAKASDIPIIHRGLSRIQYEYENRVKKEAREEITGRALKAQNAVLSARRSSIQRKIAIKRLLRERAAQREKNQKKVEARSATTKVNSPMKARLAQRIVDAQQEMSAAEHRLARLQSIQNEMK